MDGWMDVCIDVCIHVCICIHACLRISKMGTEIQEFLNLKFILIWYKYFFFKLSGEACIGSRGTNVSTFLRSLSAAVDHRTPTDLQSIKEESKIRFRAKHSVRLPLGVSQVEQLAFGCITSKLPGWLCDEGGREELWRKHSAERAAGRCFHFLFCIQWFSHYFGLKARVFLQPLLCDGWPNHQPHRG